LSFATSLRLNVHSKHIQTRLSFFNEGKSSASFCHQVAAWLQDMFCNFYLLKNLKIAKKVNNY
jgi:hypothetical protein